MTPTGQGMPFLPLLHLACLFCYGGLTAFILVKNPRAMINRLCALVLSCFMIWCLGKIVIHHPGSSRELAGFFRQIVIVGAWSFSSFLLLFSIALTDRTDLISRPWLWVAVFTIPACCIALQWYDERILSYVRTSFGWGLSWKPGPWAFILLGYIYFSILGSIYVAFKFSLKTGDANRRFQCRLIALCILASVVLGFGTNYLSPRLGWGIPDLAQNLGLLWTAGLVFAIVKYRFLTLSPSSAADQILAIISDALILIDPEGRIVAVNPAGLNMVKARRADLVGSHIGVLFPPAGKTPLSADEIMTGGDIKDKNGLIRTLDGQWIPVSLSVSGYCGEQAQPCGVILIARDIAGRIKIQDELQASQRILEERVKARTAELSDLNIELTSEIKQRKAAAVAMKQSEAMFRLISEQSLLGIVILQDNRIAYANQAWSDITEYSIQEMLSWDPRAFLSRVHEADRAHMMEQARKKQAGASDIEESYEWRLITQSGKEKWISMYSRPVPYNGRTADLATMIDVTENKRIFLSLQDSEEKYRLLVENANDAVFITQDEAIKFVNPKACEMTGYDAADLINMPFVQLILPEDRDSVIAEYRRLVNGRQQPAAYGFQGLSRTGEVVWVQNNAVRFNWEGRPATLSIVRDLTHQKKIEHMLNHMQRLEAVGTLAGGIAHDFNNILSPILGFAEMLTEDLPDGSDQHEAAMEVLAASRRAKDLTRQILTFSRQEELSLQPVKIQAILDEAIKMARAIIPSNIRVHQSIAHDCGPVMADPTQIHQVIMNLITNAYHAMLDTGGTLSLSLGVSHPPGGMKDGQLSHVQLTIKDTGIGMDEKIMEKIFDPYFSTKSQGSGLGLSVAMSIIDSLEGTIEVKSAPGKGTRFDVYFPQSENPESASIVKTTRPPYPAGNGRVMAIDDEDKILLLYDRILTRRGYRVECYKDAHDALAAFSADPEKYQLIITDMSMPRMTGDTLARKVFKKQSDFPIILCTGYSETVSAEAARAMGIKGYIMKPITSANLLHTIDTVLRSN